MRRMFLTGGLAGFLVVSGSSFLCAQVAPAQIVTAKPVDDAERNVVISTLAKDLRDDFVFPEVGARYATMLRANLARGAYNGLTDPGAFGAKVTADLQNVFPDMHLRVAPKEAFDRPRPLPAGAPVSTRPSGPPGLEEAKMIGDIAYLRFNLFPDDPAVAQKARQFLLDHANSAAVIIDARPNRGGDITVMNAVLPLLYAKRTTQLRMDTRRSVADMMPPENDPTLIRQPSPANIVRRDHVITPDAHETRLQHVPVYYLTSRRTASAAEHLALAFKRNRRATLIGETTAGANHLGIPVPLGERFLAFMPVGRSYDPSTGQDWEGKGVTPDVPVPADQALDEALREAKTAGAHPNA